MRLQKAASHDGLARNHRAYQSDGDAERSQRDPLAKHQRKNVARDAPSAARTPISRMRSLTLPERTP